MKRKRSFLLIVNLSVAGIVCAVVLLVSILFIWYLYGINDRDAMDTLHKELIQIDQELTKSVEGIYNVTSQLAADVKLGQAMDDYHGERIDASVEGKRMLDYIVNNTIAMNPSIENITLCTPSDMVQYNSYSINEKNNMSEAVQEKWYRDLLKDKVPWVFDTNNFYTKYKRGERYFFCATKFKNKYYQNRSDENRIVIVTFQLKSLETLIDNTSDLKKINLLLHNPDNGQIIYNKGVSRRYIDITEDWNGTDRETLEKNRSMFISLNHTNNLTAWTLEGFVDQSVYRAMVYPIQGWILAVIVFVLLGSVMMSLLIFRTIWKPLKNVVQGMDDLGNQDFYIIHDMGRYSETERLVTTFNKMSMRIQDLILNIEQKAKEKQKAEFRVLESQINPHFIYNTLDAIRWVALMNHSKPTAEAISSFVNFLRITLSGGKELITVDKEIEVTKEYINIMVFRNNYDIEFKYEIDEQVKKLFTLKMVLQPLVENCLIHAFDKKQKHPTILIQCYIDDGQKLVMGVSDNGKGVGGVKADNPHLSGIGIHNIDERIKIWHGDGYGLTVKDQPQGGTAVRIYQPVMVNMKGDNNDTGNVD